MKREVEAKIAMLQYSIARHRSAGNGAKCQQLRSELRKLQMSGSSLS